MRELNPKDGNNPPLIPINRAFSPPCTQGGDQGVDRKKVDLDNDQ